MPSRIKRRSRCSEDQQQRGTQPAPFPSVGQPGGPAPQRSQGPARPPRPSAPPVLRGRAGPGTPRRRRAPRYASPGLRGGRTPPRPRRSAAPPQLRSPRRDGHSPARPHMSLPAARPCAAPLNVTAPQRSAPARRLEGGGGTPGPARGRRRADPPLGAARPPRSSTATSDRAARQLRTPSRARPSPLRPAFPARLVAAAPSAFPVWRRPAAR